MASKIEEQHSVQLRLVMEESNVFDPVFGISNNIFDEVNIPVQPQFFSFQKDVREVESPYSCQPNNGTLISGSGLLPTYLPWTSLMHCLKESGNQNILGSGDVQHLLPVFSYSIREQLREKPLYKEVMPRYSLEMLKGSRCIVVLQII